MTQSLFDETRCQMICLLGTNGAGKSSSLKTLKNNSFLNTDSTPIVNFQTHTWRTKQNKINHLRIWDCSGFTQISKLTGFHVKRSHGVLIFYNSYLKHTFEDLDLWIELALNYNIPRNCIRIVRTQFCQQEGKQKQYISQSQGIEFCKVKQLHHSTIKQYNQQSMKQLYEQFGNLIIEQKLLSLLPAIMFSEIIDHYNNLALTRISNLNAIFYLSITSLLFTFTLLTIHALKK